MSTGHLCYVMNSVFEFEGMENTLEEYKRLTGDDGVDPAIQKIFDRTKHKLDDIKPFEDKLVSHLTLAEFAFLRF